MQLAKHGIPQIVSKQPLGRLNGLQEGKPRLRPLPLGYGDGAVHRVQRRRGDAIEHGVKVGDFFPAGLRERGREGMFGRDAGFRMNAAGAIVLCSRFSSSRGLRSAELW